MAVIGRVEVVVFSHISGYSAYFLVHVGTVFGVVNIGVMAYTSVFRSPVGFPSGDEIKHVGSVACLVVFADVPHHRVGIIRRVGDVLPRLSVIPFAGCGQYCYCQYKTCDNIISFSYLSRVSFMYYIDYRVILAGFVYQSLLCRLGSLRKLWHRDCKTPPEKFESCLLLHHVEWLFPSWKQPHLFLQLSFFKDILQVFADSRNPDVKQFSHRLLGSPNVFVLV